MGGEEGIRHAAIHNSGHRIQYLGHHAVTLPEDDYAARSCMCRSGRYTEECDYVGESAEKIQLNVTWIEGL